MYDNVQEVASDPDMQRVAAKLPDFQSMKSSMYRKRRARLPPLPKSRAEVNLQGEWAGTLCYWYQRRNDKIILLAWQCSTKVS